MIFNTSLYGKSLPNLSNPGTSGDLLQGKQLIDKDGNVLTGTIPTQSGTTITPGATQKTAVASGRYTTGPVYVEGSSSLLASNIKSGVSIFGVTGNYTGGSPSSSSFYLFKFSSSSPTNNYRTLSITIPSSGKDLLSNASSVSINTSNILFLRIYTETSNHNDLSLSDATAGQPAVILPEILLLFPFESTIYSCVCHFSYYKGGNFSFYDGGITTISGSGSLTASKSGRSITLVTQAASQKFFSFSYNVDCLVSK